MKDRIRQLEHIARALEPDLAQRQALQKPVLAYAEDFLEDLHNLPAYRTTPDKGEGIYRAAIGEEPISPEQALALLAESVDRPGLNPASGGHLGYIPGGGIYFSALADYLADVTNRYAGVFFASPGAVRMENLLLRWMADLVGYPQGASGNLTSGGSIANLIGIVTAREAFGLRAADIPRAVVYLTAHAHHSLQKALRIAGLQEAVLRTVAMDERFRMRPEALQEAIEKDRKDGLIPWLLIASAGTTDTGAVDPLQELGDIAARFQLWFHVDGAYGGFFMLCAEGKKILRGIHSSDSIVMDPHKSLFLPYGSGAVLVRDQQKLIGAHYSQANYMQDAQTSREEAAPADLSPELTKHFRGLRLWLPLQLLGLKPFRAALEEKLLLARYFYEEIQKVEGFEVGPYPDLSVVTYRYVPQHGDADQFNRKLVEAVQKDGRVFISSTQIDGRFTLRMAILVFRTHLETIDLAIQILREKAAEIASR